MTKFRDESKDPMSPEKIAEHKPTAVKRNPNDQEIAEGEKQVLTLLKQGRSLEEVE